IAASLPRGIAAEPLAALAATLGRELEVGADRLKRTPFQTALFSSDNGTIFLGSSAVGFVVVLGDKEVNVGLVQWALRKALASLEGAWGSAQVHVPASPDDMYPPPPPPPVRPLLLPISKVGSASGRCYATAR